MDERSLLMDICCHQYPRGIHQKTWDGPIITNRGTSRTLQKQLFGLLHLHRARYLIRHLYASVKHTTIFLLELKFKKQSKICEQEDVELHFDTLLKQKALKHFHVQQALGYKIVKNESVRIFHNRIDDETCGCPLKVLSD